MYLRSSNEIRTKYLRNGSYEWQGRNRSVLSRSRSVAQWRYRRISGQLTNLLRATYFRTEIFDVWDWALSNKCSAHVSNVPIIIFFLICVCRLVLGICNHTPPTTLSNSDLTLLSVCLSSLHRVSSWRVTFCAVLQNYVAFKAESPWPDGGAPSTSSSWDIAALKDVKCDRMKV